MKKIKEILNFRHLFEGLCLGTTLLAPGLSVATIAMVLGIYEQLLDLINDFFSSKWKEAIKVLIPLGIGAVIAILISSRAISWAFDYYPNQTYFLFLGLVIGAIPLLLKTADAKNKFKSKHLVLLVIVALLIASLDFLDPTDADHVVENLDMVTMVRLGLTGALASAAMLLPGLSASLMLLLMGTFNMLTHAVSSFDIPVIGIVMVGMLVGLILSGKGIKYLLQNHMDLTYAASIGMVIGSIVVIFPGLSSNVVEMLTCLITFAIGLFGVMLLNRKKVNVPKENGETPLIKDQQMTNI